MLRCCRILLCMQLLNPLEKIIAGIGALGLHAPPPAHEESVKVCAPTSFANLVFQPRTACLVPPAAMPVSRAARLCLWVLARGDVVWRVLGRVQEFIYRHLGEAVYKKIIDPFVSVWRALACRLHCVMAAWRECRHCPMPCLRRGVLGKWQQPALLTPLLARSHAALPRVCMPGTRRS